MMVGKTAKMVSFGNFKDVLSCLLSASVPSSSNMIQKTNKQTSKTEV